jgi:hypothetical protein
MGDEKATQLSGTRLTSQMEAAATSGLAFDPNDGKTAIKIERLVCVNKTSRFTLFEE